MTIFGDSTPVFHFWEGKSTAALGVGSYVKISTFGGLPKNKTVASGEHGFRKDLPSLKHSTSITRVGKCWNASLAGAMLVSGSVVGKKRNEKK